MRGDLEVVRMLINYYGFKEKLFGPEMKNIAHHCVVDTIDIENFRTFIQTPDIISNLVAVGSDVNATDSENRCILHLCAIYLTPKQYHQVVQLFHERADSGVFHLKDSDDRIPLYSAVHYIELLDSTLELFSNLNVDFNDVDANGDTVLNWAVRGFRSARVLKGIAEAGAEISKKSRYGGIALHEAARCENITAIRYSDGKMSRVS
ncbi:unnamed protein product [Orchesella dallaii]|uniref:Ankyrin repeat protein n=1 Tax=Orchesella dallaii TaxID=48710 RepID=A0ABP1PYP8_9HEXA